MGIAKQRNHVLKRKESCKSFYLSKMFLVVM